MNRRQAITATAVLSSAMATKAVACPPPKYKVNDLVELYTGSRLWVVSHKVKDKAPYHWYGLALKKGGDQITVIEEPKIKGKVQ